MKTLDQELQSAREKFEREQEALHAKHEVLTLLRGAVNIETYHPPMVHYHKLYGKAGSIKFHGCRYTSIAEGKNPDRELLAGLLAAFPPTPIVRVKDGCTSFRPEVQEWKGDIYECGPVLVQIDGIGNDGPHATFEWAAEIGGKLWDIEVRFMLHEVSLGKLDARVKRYAEGNGKIASWEVCQFYPARELGAQIIKWASGAAEYANSFTLYWDRDSGKALDYPALVKSAEVVRS